MNRHKFLVIIFILAMLLINNSYIIAAGSLGAGNSDPANLRIYYPNNWSNIGSWDLRDTNLADNAVVEKIKIEFDFFSSLAGQRYTGLNLFLSNGEEEINLDINEQGIVINEAFKGESIKQNWELRYFVESLEYDGVYFSIIPKLSIIYSHQIND